jgi:hypothetical protein
MLARIGASNDGEHLDTSYVGGVRGNVRQSEMYHLSQAALDALARALGKRGSCRQPNGRIGLHRQCCPVEMQVGTDRKPCGIRGDVQAGCQSRSEVVANDSVYDHTGCRVPPVGQQASYQGGRGAAIVENKPEVDRAVCESRQVVLGATPTSIGDARSNTSLTCARGDRGRRGLVPGGRGDCKYPNGRAGRAQKGSKDKASPTRATRRRLSYGDETARPQFESSTGRRISPSKSKNVPELLLICPTAS